VTVSELSTNPPKAPLEVPYLTSQPIKPQMSVTLTANYKEVLNTETVEKIDELLDENYALDDMLEFIDQRNENWFVKYYEEYVRCGEAIGYDAVDAFIDEMGGIDDIEGLDDRFRGEYESEADFAEQYYSDLYDVPCALVVDWQATFDSSLRYDFTACEKSYRVVYVFSDN
jgi:hypothetical protein